MPGSVAPMFPPRQPASNRFSRPEAGEVHVWIAFVSKAKGRLAALGGLLSEPEAAKAGRFHREEDRRRYVVAHGILRELLGGYGPWPPRELTFVHSSFGKPALDAGQWQPPLAFNLAHSGDIVLFAVAGAGRVGIDVEYRRPDIEVMEIAHSHFSAREIEVLGSLPEGERHAAFFRCWTRKEAYLKARGEGLGFPLADFTVSFRSDERPQVEWSADDAAVRDRWSMFDLGPAAGYAGAIVVDQKPVRLLVRSWVESA